MSDKGELPISVISGQAILLVLLGMAVVLTIILSILSRSVTDIAITSREEEALRAFSAAEAGFERALIAGSSIPQTQIGDASFTASVSDFAQGITGYNHPTSMVSGESAVLWYVAHNSNGDLECNSGAGLNCYTGNEMNVCWGKPGTPSGSATTPAIEVSIYYAETPGDYSTVRVARDTADPNAARTASNNFGSVDLGTCSVSGESYEFQKTIRYNDLGIISAVRNTENGLQFARIRMLYNTDTPQPFAVFLDNPIPSQGKRIESTGTSGEATRRIVIFQTFSELPPIFDSAIFSSGDLTK